MLWSMKGLGNLFHVTFAGLHMKARMPFNFYRWRAIVQNQSVYRFSTLFFFLGPSRKKGTSFAVVSAMTWRCKVHAITKSAKFDQSGWLQRPDDWPIIRRRLKSYVITLKGSAERPPPGGSNHRSPGSLALGCEQFQPSDWGQRSGVRKKTDPSEKRFP
jgi:hypothetical protein